jgi:hypothetical protein
MPTPSSKILLRNQNDSIPPTPAQPDERGNLTGNTYVALKGDWIYFTIYGTLYKIRTNGTEVTQIELDFPVGINTYMNSIHIIGDWIYTWLGGIVRFRTDGTEFTRVADIDGSIHSIVGDWIYYTDGSGEAIYRIRIDGTEQTRLTNREISHNINSVEGDWVYYRAGYGDEYPSTVFRVRTDGSAGEEMNFSGDGMITNVTVHGDWLYFRGNRGSLNRVNINTMELTQILYEDCLEYIVDGDWVYFTLITSGWEDEPEQSNLQKIRTDGTGYMQINNEQSADLNVAGDWIFFRLIECDDGSRYRIRTDGTGLEFITKRPW